MDLLCTTADFEKYFTSEYIGNYRLVEHCHGDVKTIVNTHIDPSQRHFLAQPEIKSDKSIKWHGLPFDDVPPRQLSELDGRERVEFAEILNRTLKHYNETIARLKMQDNMLCAEHLEKAIPKSIDERSVFCYPDGKVVLSIWGMSLKKDLPVLYEEIVKNIDIPVYPPKPENHAPDEQNEELTAQPEKTEGYVTKTPRHRELNFRKLLLWLLALAAALAFLLLLLPGLFRSCEMEAPPPPVNPPSQAIPSPVIPAPPTEKPPAGESKTRRCRIFFPAPTPGAPDDGRRRRKKVLPPFQGLPPVDTTQIKRIPGNPVIVGNRLNILMKDKRPILDLVNDFKQKYPEDKYRIIYWDDNVKRMQVEVPPDERAVLMEEIPDKFTDYDLFVFDEALFEMMYTPDDPVFRNRELSWHLFACRLPQAWDITTGARSITVAIVDNGFNLNPELKGSRVTKPYNVWTHSAKIFPQKEFDHGTHVAGIALASIDNRKGLAGIAPDCLFMPVQIADANGLMTVTSVLDGILYAIYQGADVINVSLGLMFMKMGAFPIAYQQDLIENRFKHEARLWEEVMSIADSHRAMIVLAAGNDQILAGVDPLHRPKHFCVVSAVDIDRLPYEKAVFSNFGPHTDVSAPGVNIYAYTGRKKKNAVYSGTSMASPIVAGCIALMKSVNPQLTPPEIIEILQATGLPVCGEQTGNMIQADKALEMVIARMTADCCEQ